MAHTPGPWRVPTDSDGDAIALVGPGGVITRLDDGLSHDDAALIAAAPDLLEAAKNVIEWVYENAPDDCHYPMADALQDAIDKAERKQVEA